jgi:hypothetical protein
MRGNWGKEGLFSAQYFRTPRKPYSRRVGPKSWLQRWLDLGSLPWAEGTDRHEFGKSFAKEKNRVR